MTHGFQKKTQKPQEQKTEAGLAGRKILLEKSRFKQPEINSDLGQFQMKKEQKKGINL